MASQQAYQAYAQNKGTLTPGQSISVNKYTVQVERYLSQGGFAHVYLVRTPSPVYNTTHHVLKRIAVANEAMLSEVKKEVDIMRVLKGHPNIVHLIDAAWHKMPNGMYEVFILMEYCPGGGIIDMMNRRLRERLTEAEILQIFVDVCEGVAFMHNSRPPLLHRDLKVENILQSSTTSYKLCDFGSATAVARPPNNMQEIRALEADLGRHTTMQYRAPEMVDLYSKRPIDEKSDVWALGVLLYKLCYYTTPFEEHGSLAILNVQYRIPPYPVYSSQMNMLIASMLREHGTQRPSVFELLNHVHYLRGTKSQFTYTVPVAQPLVPRQPPPSPGLANVMRATSNYTHSQPVVSVSRNPTATSGSPPKNQGVQARDKVLEAIAPMRRGRPNNSREPQASSSRQPSPQKNAVPISHNADKAPNWLDSEEAAWKAMSVQAEARNKAASLLDEAWKLGASSQKKDSDTKPLSTGFGDDFAEKLWRAPNPNSSISTPPKISPKPTPSLKPTPLIRPHSHTGSDALRNGYNKDAFEGLGLMTSIGKPAPTLAEARKLRTGLATMSTSTQIPQNGYNSIEKPGTSSARPTPSPRPSYLAPSVSQFQPPSPAPPHNASNTGASWLASSYSPSGLSTTGTNKDGTPIESRFPSLEELDAQFPASSLYPASARSADVRYSGRKTPAFDIPHQPPARFTPNNNPENAERLLKPSVLSTSPPGLDGTRSEQVTGVAMREAKAQRAVAENDWKAISAMTATPQTARVDIPSPEKPPLLRKHRSSVTMKYALEPGRSATASTSKRDESSTFRDKAKHLPLPAPAQDWLTGDDDVHFEPIKPTNTKSDTPVLRESPSKRASIIERSEFKIQDPVVAQHDITPVLPTRELLPPEESPTVARFTRSFPPIDTSSSYANEVSHSNEVLTGNWSPVATTFPHLMTREKELESSSSADEEGPEDPEGLDSITPKKRPSVRARRKGRQSSVHDLVDLWGGGVAPKEKEKPREKVQDNVPAKHTSSERPSKLRPGSLMPPPTKLSTTNTSTSSGPRVSPIYRNPSPVQPSPPPSGHMLREPSSSSTLSSPATSRSRPHSMFIFPSKSADSQSSQSTTLVPPSEELTPRTRLRRTSISDMVQRYEAIGGKVTTPQPVVSPPAVHKHVSIKSPTQPIQQTKVKVLPAPEKKTSTGYSTSQPVREVNEPSKPRTRTMSVGATKQPLNTNRIVTQPRRTSPVEKLASATKPVMMSSRPSHKSEPSTSVFPKRKPSTSEAQPVPSTADDDRSSSPERPYLGVGKLIDQWQRKSAESESSRPALHNKSGAVAPKRAGLVQGNRG